MYIRTISRKNKDGSVVRYFQLAQNYWDPGARCAKVMVLYNFGREEEVDRKALKRRLALLLISVAENRTGQTRGNLRAVLRRMHLGEFCGEAGRMLQRTETTAAQQRIFRALKAKEPPKLFSVDPDQGETPSNTRLNLVP